MMNPVKKITETYKGLKAIYGAELARKMLIQKFQNQVNYRLSSKLPSAFKKKQNLNPWDKPLAHRLALLAETKKKKIALFYPIADQGTFRYRVYNIFQTINSTLADYTASYFYSHETEAFLATVKEFDLVITSRFDFNPGFEKLAAAAKSHQVPLVYDIDDLLFDISYLPEIVKHLDIPEHEIPMWEDRVTRNHQAAAQADFLLCTNDFLAGKLRKTLNKPCHIIPNYLNQEQLDFAAQFKKPFTNKFWIGYFAGSSSHYKDFELIEDEVIQVLEKYPDINLRLVGYIKLSEKLRKYSKRIDVIGLRDFMGYLEILGTCDLVLVPLVINDFTNCKSELKYFEAGLMHAPVITSPTYIYQKVIREGENGMMADQGEWFDKISKIYEDKTLYSSIVKAAHHDSIASYSGEKITSQIHNFLKAVL